MRFFGNKVQRVRFWHRAPGHSCPSTRNDAHETSNGFYFFLFGLYRVQCKRGHNSRGHNSRGHNSQGHDSQGKIQKTFVIHFIRYPCWFEQLLPLDTLMFASWYTVVNPVTDCNLSSSIWKLQWEIIITDHITVQFQPVSQPASQP